MNSTYLRSGWPQALSDLIRSDLQYYYYSCQAIALFSLPLSLCGIIASSFIIFLLLSNGHAHYHRLFGYAEVFSSLFVNIGELICLRFSLLLPTIVAYKVNISEEGVLSPFDPMFRAGPIHCKTLAFVRHFFGSFRCNLMVATCFRIGWETIHPPSTYSSLCPAFLIALISSIPVLILTDYWKVCNLTICDFDMRIHPFLLAWANIHCILYCDALVPLSLVILLSRRVDALQLRLDTSSLYLRNTSPKSFFMLSLFTSLSGKLKETGEGLALLSYYYRFSVPVKLLFAIAKLCAYLYNRQFAVTPTKYVSFCLWKATADNYTCLFDVIQIMFAPVWWYCMSIQLRAKVGMNCFQEHHNKANQVRRNRPPTEFAVEDYGKVEAVEFFNDNIVRQVVKYKEWLLIRNTKLRLLPQLQFQR